MADYAKMIADLLAKAEGTDIEAEADTFREKAFELMTKYAIDQAEIDAKRVDGSVQEEIVEEELIFRGTYKDGTFNLAGHVINAFPTVRTYVEKNVWLRHRVNDARANEKGHVRYIVGYESDVRQVKLLVESLQLQAASALLRWWKDDAHALVIKELGTAMEKFKAKREFLISFGYGASTKIAKRFKDVIQERGTGTEVMIRDRGTAVDEWLKKLNLVQTSNRLSRGSVGAQVAGMAAGREARTGEPEVGPRRNAIGA